MCGRFVSVLDLALARELYGADYHPEALPALEAWRPNFNVAPTQDVPTVYMHGGRRVIAPLAWGWRPPWKSGPLINAQSEGAPTKRTFAKAFRERRCVIPAHGFYEWRAEASGRKRAVFFDVPSEPLVGIAGLWTDEREEQGGMSRRVLLLTTAPNALVSPIHDRMPVLLDRDAAEVWLTPDAPEEVLSAQCRPFPDDRLRARLASTAVNQVRSNGPELIADCEPL